MSTNTRVYSLLKSSSPHSCCSFPFSFRFPIFPSFVAAMENYARDEDSQDIYLEVAILITDASPTAREMLLQVKREKKKS